MFAKKDLIKVWKAGLDTVRKILEILGTDHTNEEVRLATFISARDHASRAHVGGGESTQHLGWNLGAAKLLCDPRGTSCNWRTASNHIRSPW